MPVNGSLQQVCLVHLLPIFMTLVQLKMLLQQVQKMLILAL
ncbi:Protein of unknown function [Gryllus bimaculatus]|nr:Protein of unknown function [Gryllus bimaculatus]